MVTKTYKQNANSAHNHSDSVVTLVIGSWIRNCKTSSSSRHLSYVIGSEKRDHFAEFIKIALLV